MSFHEEARLFFIGFLYSQENPIKDVTKLVHQDFEDKNSDAIRLYQHDPVFHKKVDLIMSGIEALLKKYSPVQQPVEADTKYSCSGEKPDPLGYDCACIKCGRQW